MQQILDQEKRMINDYTERHTAFTGCFNFRDIGGYPTADGQRVRWGQYFRAGRQDRMTPADLEQLKALGIKTQIDLRMPAEAADQGPGPLGAMGASYHNIAVIPEGGTTELSRLVGDTAISGKRYLGYLEFGPQTWHKLFALYANAADHPLLIHCTAGKDRTGVSTAFLLTVLGVDRSWIEADYVLTNRDVSRQLDFLEANIGLPEGMSRSDMQHHAGVPENAMTDFLDGLTERWGSPMAYLEHIGIAEETFAKVRKAFLET